MAIVNNVIATSTHRNGIMGTPFGTVIFEHDGHRMIGIVLDKESDKDIGNVNCFVLDLDLAAQNNIGFDNGWRGDHFADELRAALGWDN